MGKKHGASGIYRIESENIPLLLSFPKKEINPGIYIISVVQSNCCILLKKFIVLK